MKPAIEWKDPRTYREPTWPLGGYAPGKYIGQCTRCSGNFMGLDKRASHCFPCAVEAINEGETERRAEVRRLRQENEALRVAIQLVSPAPD